MLQFSSYKNNLVKPLKIVIIGPNLLKKGVRMTISKMKINFFAEITKENHKLSKTFIVLSKFHLL